MDKIFDGVDWLIDFFVYKFYSMWSKALFKACTGDGIYTTCKHIIISWVICRYCCSLIFSFLPPMKPEIRIWSVNTYETYLASLNKFVVGLYCWRYFKNKWESTDALNGTAATFTVSLFLNLTLRLSASYAINQSLRIKAMNKLCCFLRGINQDFTVV